jgi:hypothetical protein
MINTNILDILLLIGAIVLSLWATFLMGMDMVTLIKLAFNLKTLTKIKAQLEIFIRKAEEVHDFRVKKSALEKYTSVGQTIGMYGEALNMSMTSFSMNLAITCVLVFILGVLA